jgi:hypothetical protein
MPKQKHALFVYSDPVEGREDDFNAWYNDVHLKEVLTVEGFVRAQRYKVADVTPGITDHKYVAIYEIESDDLEATLAKLQAAVPSMNLGNSINLQDVKMSAATAVSDAVEG